MMVSHLPEDLVEEILSRVPGTSLKRIRLTCKRWKALIKEPEFSEKHFRNAPKQSRLLMLKDFRLCPVIVDLNVVPPSIEFNGALNPKDSHSNSEQVDIATVSHLDGLLLCITRDDRLVVWNPYLGEARWIQQENGYKNYSSFNLGYENKKSGRNYKVLMHSKGFKTKGLGLVSGFEVYEFSSSTWRVVNAPKWVRTIYHRGVALKGNIYWICHDEKDNYFLSFDFTKETFGRLCLPTSPNRGYKALSVVGEEKLLVLRNSSDTSKMDIWVTNKFNTKAELSWSKYFSVGVNRIRPFMCLLIDEEKKVALCYNTCSRIGLDALYTIGEDDKYFTEIPCREEPCLTLSDIWLPFIFNYVPSLVHIQSN
ncbi:unnamed protein product [Microthlaspi erraticum]|uniref:F-box domain-containing protein n=1 Tax=Microthlaspi erraticum TaxID=1685480 RepID=A0A6D2HTV7_9BRAS|nr:unnamed protein product [Microthlaspi erraticum]CAA7024461.1 unnamed protein product [Microthlaspi erraticum]